MQHNKHYINRYIIIRFKHIKSFEIYPFNLYLYSKKEQEVTLFLSANNPKNLDLLKTLKNIKDKSDHLIVISCKQWLTFLNYTKANAKVVDLIKEDNHNRDTRFIVTPDFFNAYRTNKKTLLQNKIAPVFLRDDYKELLNWSLVYLHQYNDEICELTRLDQISYLLEKTNSEKILQNKILSLTLFFINLLNEEKNTYISEVLTTIFLFNLGYTQIEHKFVNLNFNQFNNDEKEQFENTWEETTKMASLLQISLTDNEQLLLRSCLNLILPKQFNSDIVNKELKTCLDCLSLAFYIVYYCEGLIDGTIKSFDSFITSINEDNLHGDNTKKIIRILKKDRYLFFINGNKKVA